jgi:NAD(P)H-dependent FMN reductase
VVSALEPHFEVDLVDLSEVDLPFFDEPGSPAQGAAPVNAHTRAWAKRVAGLDAVVIVTPEYNAGYPAVLKNALDYLFTQWNAKPVAVVAYGWHHGRRVAAALSPVLANLRMHEVAGLGLQFNEHLVDAQWSTVPEVTATVDADLRALRDRLEAALAAATQQSPAA